MSVYKVKLRNGVTPDPDYEGVALIPDEYA